MARPLRIEFPGAVYHVMARGNDRAAIFRDDEDRQAFVDNLGRCAERFDWRIWAYCLMDNHYHLLLETRKGNLCRGMRQVNGVYTQAFNRRHERVGHVLQGRYKAILVDKDSYLLELSRYIVLNPVRAAQVKSALDWPWSVYRAVLGKVPAPAWLAVSDTLALFHRHSGPARRAYARFVEEGLKASDPGLAIQRQSFLGGEDFVARMEEIARCQTSPEIPRQARPVRSLASLEREAKTRDEAIRNAYETGLYKLSEIAAHFGLHYSTVSRIARGVRRAYARSKT